MKTFYFAVLVLVGFFAGGCSIIFLPILIMLNAGYGWYFHDVLLLLIPVAGIGLAIVCALGAWGLARKD